MGLQSSLATKRKHDLTLNNEKELDLQSSCPPLKTAKWSSGANKTQDNIKNYNNNNNNDIEINNKNDNIENKTNNTISTNDNNNNNSQERHELKNQQQIQHGQDFHKSQVNCLLENTTNLTKLEVVTATPNDLWNSEPVDCISKLQAVAVPSDPWGSLTNRSTLATTLLSADELEDDDDDFDDDYEEEESIIPTYCPARYNCPPPHFLQRNTINNGANSPTNGANNYAAHNSINLNNSYLGKPNYYSEPFPQQNCSRTINQQQQQSQHFRFGTLNSWNHLSVHQNNNYYNMHSVDQAPIGSNNGIIIGNGNGGYTQQTIRCAENGKSYLELGSSTFTANPVTINNNGNLNIRHSKKCGCDGRGIWCNSKNCYRDIRLKIRNLSMFKLSKFRQVSEQSLYRSVLICNTLKNIDREIELENKDSHHLHHNHPIHMGPHMHHPLNNHHLHGNGPLSILSNNPNHNSNNDFSIMGNCPKVCTITHDQSNNLVYHPSSNQYNNISPSESENVREYNNIQNQLQQQNNQQQQQQQQHNQHLQQSILTKSSSSMLFNNGSNNHCVNELLHPYDHYPFREAQLGRATPFPMESAEAENTDNIPITSSQVASTIANNVNNALYSTSAVNTTSSPTSMTTTTTLTPIINSTANLCNQQNPASLSPESDSGYSDDESNRSINWSSVLSLSSQSELDPLNNNDLFSILPSASTPTAITTATSTNMLCINSLNSSSNSMSPTVASNSTLITINSRNSNNNNIENNNESSNSNFINNNNNNVINNNNNNNNSNSSNNNSNKKVCNNNNNNNNNNTSNSTSITTSNNNNLISTSHVTTLSTLTSLTSTSSLSLSTLATVHHHQLLESNNNCSASSIQANTSTWEYNFLDMDLGIGSELTELVPHHCKLTSDDIFKSISTPLNSARYVHDNEIESPAHIMVGS